jgi:hypothetical protein
MAREVNRNTEGKEEGKQYNGNIFKIHETR